MRLSAPLFASVTITSAVAAQGTAADRFVQEALARNAPIDVLNHPEGRHGFDILDDDDRSREVIARTLEFLRARLPR